MHFLLSLSLLSLSSLSSAMAKWWRVQVLRGGVWVPYSGWWHAREKHAWFEAAVEHTLWLPHIQRAESFERYRVVSRWFWWEYYCDS